MGQQCIGKTLEQCYQEVPETTLHRKNPFQCCHNTLLDNMTQVKTLYNVVQEALDNIAQERLCSILS